MGQVDALCNRMYVGRFLYIIFRAHRKLLRSTPQYTWLKRWYRNMPTAISQLSENCQFENAKRQTEIRHRYYKCHVCQRLILLLRMEKRRSNIFFFK